MEQNPTVVFRAPKTVGMENRPMPTAGEGQVLIRTRLTLISTGTELTILNSECPPDSYWASYGKLPFDPGYDNIGDVAEAGPGVDRALVGQRVGTWGNHARYVVQNAADIRPISRPISDEQAVFFTIVEICMNSVRRAGVKWGEAVVVYGMGLLGQFVAQLCHLAGARPVVAVDVADSRLNCLPKRPGMVPVNAVSEDAIAVVKRATRGRMADVVFEVTGDENLLIKEFEALHKQGRFVVLGCPRGKTSFDFHDLCCATSHTIIGTHNMSHPPVATLDNPWTNHRHAELFFDLVADGELAVEPLISHREDYTRALDLYKMLLADRSQAMGIVLNWT